MLPEILGFVALSAAVLAWMRAGRLSRKLEALNQSYWELRYDYTRLRSQVARLDPETEEAAATAEASPSQPQGTVAFVSLSSMKKKN